MFQAVFATVKPSFTAWLMVDELDQISIDQVAERVSCSQAGLMRLVQVWYLGKCCF
jgi:hypothetical protein